MAIAEGKAIMFLNMGLFISLLLLVSIVEGKQGCKTDYEFQNGDLCYTIWQKFHLTQDEFYRINPNIDCDKLVPGQYLCIDGGLVSPPASAPQKSPAPGSENIPKCKKEYQVKSGDTCYAIWMKFNLTQNEFYEINPNIVCEKLIIDQLLCIDELVPSRPVKPPTPAPHSTPAPGPKKPKCRNVYDVQSGDTCYAIWQKFNLPQTKFEKNNPNVICDMLQIGQKLCIDGKM